MAGLDDLDATNPAGSSSPTTGDDEIRATKAKTKEYAAAEHAGDGKHKFPILASLPAFGTAGRLVIKTTPGVQDELWYDTGAMFIKLTSNQSVIDYIANLTTHAASNPIDHVDNSITKNKIAASEIVYKHLAGGATVTSIAALVNTANADTLHKHGTAGIENLAVTTAKIPDGAVTTSKISGTLVNGSNADSLHIHINTNIGNTVTVGAPAHLFKLLDLGVTWLPPSGIYQFATGVGLIELYTNGNWYNSLMLTGLFFTDGIILRITGTGSTVFYHYW